MRLYTIAVSIDPSTMAGGMLSRFSHAEITGDDIFLQNDLRPSFPLDSDDAEITINATTAGMTMTMTRKRTNSEITGKKISLPLQEQKFLIARRLCITLKIPVDQRFWPCTASFPKI